MSSTELAGMYQPPSAHIVQREHVVSLDHTCCTTILICISMKSHDDLADDVTMLQGTPKSSTSHHVVPSIPSSKQHVPSTPMNQQHACKPDISSSLSIGSITPRPPQHATAAAAPSSSAVPPHARQRDSSAAPPPHVNAARSMSHGTSSAPQHHAAATQQQASPAKDRMQAASQHAVPEQRAEAADRSTGALRSQHAGADQPCMPGWLDRAPACSTPAHASRDASEAETTPGEVATHGAWSAIREFVQAFSPPDEV